MVQLQQRKTYLPFGYKLMLSYAVLIMIPVLLVGYSANSIFVNSIREQTHSNIQGTLRQMQDNIMYKMDDMKRISDMLYYDNALSDHLYHYEEGWVSFQATRKYLLPRLNTTIEATNSTVWLSLYLHNESFGENYSFYDGKDPFTLHKRLYDIYHIKRIKDKDWYKQFPEEDIGKTIVWKQIEDDKPYSRISLLRRIIDLNRYDAREIGFLRLSVRFKDLFMSLDYNKIGEGTTLFITDEKRRIVSLSGNSSLKRGDVWNVSAASSHLLITQTLPELGWTLNALVPNSIIERDSTKVNLLTVLICISCFVVFAIAGVFVSRFFSRRVTKIVSVLDSFQEGEFHKRILFKGNDEFTQISNALNEMGHNIGGLIREVYVKDLQKKEAELASLQAQINPHFLYNTLSSISRLAKFGEVDKLHRMVLDLAKFYRLSLSDGKNMISVFHELEQVRAYIDIQKTKYGDRMEVLYDIEPSIVAYQMLKLTIQPFVENALEHAWCGDQISIRLTGRLEGGSLVFQIIDDGVGFHPETVRLIFGLGDSTQAGYGIRNVDQRIKLHYGKAYGITIGSRPGVGSTIRITFPARREDQKRP